MEVFELKEDLKVIYNTAKSFPEGIQEAFDRLEAALPDCDKRTWYGMSSRNEEGVIIYKAAITEQHDGEAAKVGFTPFTIIKGTYITETIFDWMQNTQLMGSAFMKLLEDPRIPHDGYCLEWYKNDNEVMCMIRIA
jgi:predicted transcriptional regulator YdeE